MRWLDSRLLERVLERPIRRVGLRVARAGETWTAGASPKKFGSVYRVRHERDRDRGVHPDG